MLKMWGSDGQVQDTLAIKNITTSVKLRLQTHNDLAALFSSIRNKELHYVLQSHSHKELHCVLQSHKQNPQKHYLQILQSANHTIDRQSRNRDIMVMSYHKTI